MSQAVTIDTLRFSNRLKEAGLPGEQAEALAHAIDAELNGAKTTVATLIGEVHVLKWAAGIALAFIFGAFAILYQGQAAIVGVQTDLRERVTRVEEQMTQMDARMIRMEEQMTRMEAMLRTLVEKQGGTS